MERYESGRLSNDLALCVRDCGDTGSSRATTEPEGYGQCHADIRYQVASRKDLCCAAEVDEIELLELCCSPPVVPANRVIKMISRQ